MRSLYIAVLVAFFPSPIRVVFYRLTGSKIGKRVKIGFGTVILANKIEIGDNSVIGNLCRIKVHTLSLGKYVSIGNFVKISVNKIRMDSRVTVSSTVHIEGDSNDERSVIKLGMHSWIFQHCYINVDRQVTLGRNVGVGGGTYLFTHGHWLSKLDGFPVNYGSVSIDDNVWIPWDCFIMPGVKIGKKVVVGARSLINKDVPENALVAGIPAKIVKDISYRRVDLDEKIKIIKESIQDFSERHNKNLEMRETVKKIDYSFDNDLFLCLYKSPPKVISELSKTGLNVIFDNISIDTMNRYPCYSLNDYSSSSVELISQISFEWLQFVRYIGLRFYPVDESDSAPIGTTP